MAAFYSVAQGSAFSNIVTNQFYGERGRESLTREEVVVLESLSNKQEMLIRYMTVSKMKFDAYENSIRSVR